MGRKTNEEYQIYVYDVNQSGDFLENLEKNPFVSKGRCKMSIATLSVCSMFT